MSLHFLGASMNDWMLIPTLLALSLPGSGLFSEKVADDDELLEALGSSPEKVRSGFLQAYEDFVYAVSYRTPVFGGLIRRGFERWKKNRGGTARKALQRAIRHGERHHQLPAAAYLGRHAASHSGR
jgi:hypothetical protein